MAASLALVGGIGCNSTCDDICERYSSCDADLIFPDGCEWEDDEDEVMDKCVESCEDEYDKLSDGDAEEVDACIECVLDEVGDSCSSSKMNDAIEDDCDSDCDDSDVGDFFEDFYDDWDPQDDVDCPMYADGPSA